MAQELKVYYSPNPDCTNVYYLKNEVDAVLAEKDAEITELKAKLESVQASMYADVVDAGMENRRLKRALWLARAERAKWQSCYYWYAVSRKHDSRIFDEVERKCRAKAEEYK